MGYDEQYARASRANQSPEVQRMMEKIRGPMTLVIRVIGLAIGGFVIYGGIKMKKLESYGVCIAASIVALLPCSFCCPIGLAFGIWALVVLNNADVKNSFS
jgi:type IV secretory pathway VirB2 component (pilin)